MRDSSSVFDEHLGSASVFSSRQGWQIEGWGESFPPLLRMSQPFFMRTREDADHAFTFDGFLPIL